MWWKRIAFLILMCIYISIYVYQEERNKLKEAVLPTLLPISLYQVMGGYTKQLMAESIFIQSVVFLGSSPLPEVKTYKDNLHQHYLIIQELHPYLSDTYYLTESSLSWISQEDVKRVNAILAEGMLYNDDFWVLYFFKGFNEFHYLDDPVTAANTLYGAANLKSTPKWLTRLATILAAKGGELEIGLVWLQAMKMNEQNPEEVKRYEESILTFKKAIEVKKALLYYKKKNQSWPESLDDLVPDFISELPLLKGDQYALSYVNQKLRLVRKK